MAGLETPQVVDRQAVLGTCSLVAMNAAFGSLVLLPACIVFKGSAARYIATGVGVGVGAGSSFMQADLYIRYPNLVPPPVSPAERAERFQAGVEDTVRSTSAWFSNLSATVKGKFS